MRAINLTGQKFGRLVVVERAPNTKDNKASWLCRCECGNHKTVRASDLKSGRVKSCGCLYYDSRKTVARNQSGEKSHFYKHGLCYTRINSIYRGMKKRCNNPNEPAFKRYGGRGIKVCDEWESDFMSFYKRSVEHGYSDSLTLDRIDVNGNYSPDNCRWVTMKEQQNNRRDSAWIEYGGERHTISEWSSILGISKSALYHRYEKGFRGAEVIQPYIAPELEIVDELSETDRGEDGFGSSGV